MKVLIGNFKGPQGEQGIEGKKGDIGEIGPRGSIWTSGTGITGTSTIGTIFETSGITDAHLHDYYINTDTGNLYECIVPGAADVAEWVHVGNFKGPTGATGPAGSISNINEQKPTYEEASKLENINSGETVAISFGKLKKALSVFLSHYMQKATTSILGHVKLSNSSAITKTGEYALDAIEKNAAVEGTLANLISQQNSNINKKSEGFIKWGGDCNGLGFGTYLTNSSANTPTANAWHMVISTYQDGTGVQLAIPLIDAINIYVRMCSGNNWSPWKNPLTAKAINVILQYKSSTEMYAEIKKAGYYPITFVIHEQKQTPYDAVKYTTVTHIGDTIKCLAVGSGFVDGHLLDGTIYCI